MIGAAGERFTAASRITADQAAEAATALADFRSALDGALGTDMLVDLAVEVADRLLRDEEHWGRGEQ